MNERNLTFSPSGISKSDRAHALGHQGAIVWLTGLSGSGKSTLCHEVERMLIERRCAAYTLDGDNLRLGLNRDLGFSAEDRQENIRRVGEVARLFCDAGLIVLTAFISPFRADRDRVRAMMGEGEFLEVHVATPLEECERRDVKGLYAKARRGELREFTGIDSPYEAPVRPELVVGDDAQSAGAHAQAIVTMLEQRGLLDRARAREHV